jgi:TFIIF-interacting CTD phosphatase-like protein
MEVLRALKEYYRIAIFTASVKAYADTILDFLDPNNEIFEARLYREHCTSAKSVHVKDLRLFREPDSKHDENWKLDEMILSKRFQPFPLTPLL